ncbi:MAG: hypothetical protein OHK0031_18820 [Anaerolineales bacterium]
MFSFSIWNFVRFYAAITRWETLQRLGADPLYLAGSGLGWGLMLFFFARALLNGWRPAPLVGVYISLLYFLFYWGERLFLQVSPADNLPFAVVTSISIYLLTSALLFMAAKEENQ